MSASCGREEREERAPRTASSIELLVRAYISFVPVPTLYPFCVVQSWKALYRWQHVYLPILYGLLTFKFRLQDITDTYWKRESGNIRVNYYDNPWIRIVLTKGLWVVWRVLLPLYYFHGKCAHLADAAAASFVDCV